MPDILAPRLLGRTPLTVSPITIGASSLGSRPEADALAEAMLAAPFAVVDTSNNYSGGASETTLGQALAARGGLTAGHSIVTKIDADGDGRFDRDRVWRSYEESRDRLGIDTFPLLHLHDPYAITVDEAFAPGGAVQGMIELRDQGLAGAIGIAVGELSIETAYVRSGVFDAVLTHNRYTLIDRRAEGLIVDAHAQGMGVFNAAPFGSGILAGNGTRYAYREASPELLAWVERLRAVCAARGVSTAAVALHHSLRNPGIHSTVVGVGRPARLLALDVLYRTEIPDAVWDDVARLGTPPSPIAD